MKKNYNFGKISKDKNDENLEPIRDHISEKKKSSAKKLGDCLERMFNQQVKKGMQMVQIHCPVI